MYKFVFVAIVALAALSIQENEAFIIVSKSISAAPAGSVSASAAPAIDPNALIQGITNAVTAKIQTVTQVVNGLVQAKANIKQNLLRNVLNSVNSASSALPAPGYITKTIRIPVFVKSVAAPATPAATTTSSAAVPVPEATTTTSQSAGYLYSLRHRH